MTQRDLSDQCNKMLLKTRAPLKEFLYYINLLRNPRTKEDS